ncbi:monovalent cation/H+ antiporter complex subunit F [Boseongicola sp. H5]|uniref:monovalent cation/H+ antiporter complex subunit F n=1 Tax=Rhodobacterales TaxID=204455 RepID=UPI001B22131F|nr:cation:proton antiporter [Boseongicola sp. H5]MBO6602231.1 cation:proton antiporter [Roseicyclus sp.]MBO6624132.1 cation:proton antiporter [Roseicyclus sp.]MBO6923236.1 cation:proton antiporter [Roseicyclus sp.]
MEILQTAVDIAFVIVMLGVLFAFIRLIKGPSLPDRIVALDMMTVQIVAICALFAISSGETAFLDVAIVLALVGFLATVALARFVERREAGNDDRALTPDLPQDEETGP